jgi:hypothetical protein
MSNPITNGIQYSVKFSSKPSFKVTRETTVASNYFQELVDVSVPDISKTTPNPNRENYVVAYNSTLNKFVIVDPDTVLSAAATTSSVQPGLPTDFVDTLDVDLDDRIDLDAGSF